MSNSESTLFRYAREASAVRVGNIPPGVSGREIVQLFRTLVGPIRNVEMNGSGCTIELTFATPDDAMKSLCMSGYTVAGSAITVTTVNSSKPTRVVDTSKPKDTRRNLYVLGLPFDLSKAELTAVFSRCGTVCHCVILATVDNASRRRGFVVMSSHAEARAAMDTLSRTDIRGSMIDVSWAVVQRSEGFLDGGDRTVGLETHSESPPGTSLEIAASESLPIVNISPIDASNTFPATSCASVVVSNLPTLLFSQSSDLEPLFFPFGNIKKLDRMPPSPSDLVSGSFSVVVTYSTAASAQDAKDTLQGQVYGNQALMVDFVSPFRAGYRGSSLSLGTNYSNSSRSSLNPHASPFVLDYACPLSAPPTCAMSDHTEDYFSDRKPLSSGLASPVDPFYAAGFVPYHYRSLPTSVIPSRSSSAASWVSFDSTHATPRASRPPFNSRFMSSDSALQRF
ncbi:hypothetical protein FA95DRAFT_1557164 [Auriscalpium vulgare]|uniref:Uncharacterized protein n=1 Tax=Auriscalpium vulgare TaxID=40419 RepID=A0ACB8RZ98_9AGAM|nr:hypothetical protein FA95DRAFT_1557164 [Auriscalpium vulgare]